jgi:hypothetical protein
MAVDGVADNRIDCGAGVDRLRADAVDPIDIACETTLVSGMRIADGRVGITLRCPSGCKGRLMLRDAKARAAGITMVSLSRKAEDTGRPVTLRLNAAGKRALSSAGRLHGTLGVRVGTRRSKVSVEFRGARS